MVSNNYWITDTRPCLTYGMRGSINMEVCATPISALGACESGQTLIPE